MKRIFEKPPRVSFRRPKNLKDELVRSEIKGIEGSSKGVRKCGKARCQICNFVKEGNTFCDNTSKVYYVNYEFDCDSEGVIYLLKCGRCHKHYVGSTINSFRKRFNNHKSSLLRYGKGKKGMPGEHLYSHFFAEGHVGLNDVTEQIIDRTDVTEPTEREAFWALSSIRLFRKV